MANYYSLTGHSTHVTYYATGAGPIVAGQPPPGPSLEYISGSIDVVATGDALTITTTPIGQFVTALIKENGVPGARTYFSVLIPDVKVGNQGVAVHSIGVLSITRPVSNIGPGQIESYTELALQGTASNIERPQ